VVVAASELIGINKKKENAVIIAKIENHRTCRIETSFLIQCG
jgi:hypothetical protein